MFDRDQVQASAKGFVDSNVWLYALMRPKQGESGKHARALALIGELREPVVTPQIINKVCFNLLRKGAWDEVAIRLLLADWQSRCRVHIPSGDWGERASQLRERFGFSFWDGLIVAGALSAGSDVLCSEDMQDGLLVAGLEIVSPFRSL